MRIRVYLVSILLSLTVSSNALGQTTNPTDRPTAEKPVAPPFNLTSLQGKRLDLAALRGRVVVLNFWFTGCKPCVAEFGELNTLVKEYKKKEVVFIAPTLDNVSTLKAFFKEHKFKYHIVPNAGGLIASTYSDASANIVFPTHIVIDKEGKIDTRITGSAGLADLQKAIARLVDVKIEKTK